MENNSIILVILVLIMIGIILAAVFPRRRRMQLLQNHFVPEYDHTVRTLGDEKKAEMELINRQTHVEALNIRPLNAIGRTRYLADWAAVQSKFLDEPGAAIVYADRLTVEIMLLRGFPVADFDQRAADIFVNYPDLAINYMAARDIVGKNRLHQADTKELCQAMIYYRSLFEELLAPGPVAVKEK